MSTLPTVQFGPFRTYTKGDLDAVRFEWKAQRPSISGRLTSASVNGQSYTIGGVEFAREEALDHLAAAYCSLGIYDYGQPAGNRAVALFTAPPQLA